MSEFENVNFFTDRAVQDDPYPYFDWVREPGPGVAGAQLRDVHHHGSPRSDGRLQRPSDVPSERPAIRDLLVVQCGVRVVREVLHPFEGDDVSDIIVRTAGTSCPSATSSRRSTHRTTRRIAIS